MSTNLTTMRDAPVAEYLAGVEPPARREDALVLDRLFRDETGFQPQLWGPSMIGYGLYHYRYDSGREGTFLATGFAPRKANMVVYILPGYADFGHILRDLGPHKLGKSCLYLGRLSGIDLDALRRLIRAGLEDLATRWEVHPT